MTAHPMARCPVCRRRFPADESRPMPFCSERCRQVDLGRWLGEEYALPCDPEAEEEPPEPQPE